ncbi:MAG TPA: hypothetical protein VNO53_09520, partial [Steroidobacteraceae bacterium]|nr:hypothetical protein [Steroidobacteraceae bacterium]
MMAVVGVMRMSLDSWTVTRVVQSPLSGSGLSNDAPSIAINEACATRLEDERAVRWHSRLKEIVAEE